MKEQLTAIIFFIFTIMFNLYMAQEALEVESYRARVYEFNEEVITYVTFYIIRFGEIPRLGLNKK